MSRKFRTMKISNLSIIRIEEDEEFHLKGPQNNFKRNTIEMESESSQTEAGTIPFRK